MLQTCSSLAGRSLCQTASCVFAHYPGKVRVSKTGWTDLPQAGSLRPGGCFFDQPGVEGPGRRRVPATDPLQDRGSQSLGEEFRQAVLDHEQGSET